ncbi:MAG: helix-turn-helix domain-containing protein, partial [Candidatus Dadabacteria bacterium]
MAEGMPIDLRKLRELRGLTQADLAKHVRSRQGRPLGQSQVSRYEENPDSIPLGLLLQWLDVLGVDIEAMPLRWYLGEACRLERTRHRLIEPGSPYRELERKVHLLKEYLHAWGGSKPADLPFALPSPERFVAFVEQTARKPHLCLFGTGGSGKTSLANVLLGLRGPKLPVRPWPTTSVPVYVRHVIERPAFMQERVWVMGEAEGVPFDPTAPATESYYLRHRLAAGGFDTIREQGFHAGFAQHSGNRPSWVLVFLDAPILRACTIIDTPALEAEPLSENRVAAWRGIRAEICVYVSSALRFLSPEDFYGLKYVLSQLSPPSGDRALALRRLFVVMTNADLVGDASQVSRLLDDGAERAFEHLGKTFRDWAKSQGVDAKRDALRSR